MKVTMKAIADAVGVSVNTVSLALRNMPGVKAETRDKIFEAAKELGYISPKDGAGVRNICLVSTAERLRDSYFFMSFYQIILGQVQQYGYNMLIFHSNNIHSTEAFKRNLQANSVSGIIVLGDMEEEVVSRVAACDIPMIVIGARYHNVEVPTFIEDNLEGAFLAVGHLYHQGYRSIGFIGNPAYSTAFMERYEGFVGAKLHYGLPAQDPQSLLEIDPVNRYDFHYMAGQLAHIPEMPKAFICANDNLAITAAKALHSMDIHIPDDVALIGFDSSESGRMFIPSITSVDVRCAAQAEASVRKLMEFIDMGKTDAMRYVLPVRLVEGDSVATIRRPDTPTTYA